MTFTGNFVYFHLAKNRANLMLLVALLYIYTCSMLLALTEGISPLNHFGAHLAKCSISPLIYFPIQFQSQIRFSEVQHNVYL